MYPQFIAKKPYTLAYGLLSNFRGRFMYPRIFSHLDIREDIKILDVGTGRGSIFLPKPLFNQGTIIGLDYSPTMISHAKKYATNLEEKTKNIRTGVVRGDSTKLPFPNNYFDIIIDSWQLPHLARLSLEDHIDEKPHYEALQEYARVIHPEGTIIINPSQPWNKPRLFTLLFQRKNAKINSVIRESLEELFTNQRINEKHARYNGSFWVINGS